MLLNQHLRQVTTWWSHPVPLLRWEDHCVRGQWTNSIPLELLVKKVNLLPRRFAIPPSPEKIMSQWRLKSFAGIRMEKDTLSTVTLGARCWEKEDLQKSISVLHWIQTGRTQWRLFQRQTLSNPEQGKRYVNSLRRYLSWFGGKNFRSSSCYYFSCLTKLWNFYLHFTAASGNQDPQIVEAQTYLRIQTFFWRQDQLLHSSWALSEPEYERTHQEA